MTKFLFAKQSFAGVQYPNALTTGPAAGGFTSLTPQTANIPGTAPYPSYVQVQGDGSLLVQACSFSSTLTCDASNIRFVGCQFTATGFYAVQPGPDATGPWTFSYCQASAPDSTAADNLFYGFPMPDGLSSAQRSVVDHCNLFWFSAQPVIAVNHVMISNNFVHDIVTVSGNHCEALYLGTAGGGGTCTDVIATGNTLLPGPSTNNTAAIYLDAHGNNYSGYVLTNNLVAGGSYCMYLGEFTGFTDTGLVVTGNQFSTVNYSTGGQFGYATNAPTWNVSGNVWSGNTWYDGPNAGQALAAP